MTLITNKLPFLILGFFLLMMTACSNNDETEPDDNYISAEAYLNNIGYSGSVLIHKNGQDILRKGFGMADKANGVPNDPSLIYRIGSVTKSFTATAIMNLKRDGLIESLDQKLSDFDETFPHGDKITIRHLLTHQSGIPEYSTIVGEYDKKGQQLDKDEILELIFELTEEKGLEFTPGQYVSYCNSNFYILGMLIEELTDMTYQEYLHKKIYEPLNLQNTGKSPDIIQSDNRAKGYNQDAKADSYRMDIAYSAGEMESNITDLEKWGKAFLGDYFTQAEKSEIFAEKHETHGVNTVGAGWFTLNFEGRKIYHHGGDVNGFTSLLMLVPESNGIVILLSNEQDKGEQRIQIMEQFLRKEF
ncbi:serine hydrolase (plasmid) [Fulvitalea axinellae]|uniref:Serine hydrolase n=1 Tax=Fulvitalea axinellae TaxID=1182444 RepID=A0AAU9CUP1_9BACT|nr:serine hydrolase [Fulvitalea axinellae]